VDQMEWKDKCQYAHAWLNHHAQIVSWENLFEEKQFLIDYIMHKYEPDSFFNHLVIIESILESSPNIHTIYNAVLSVITQRE